MAVELILSIEDKEKRDKMNKFARQALDRAEELKGIKKESPTEDPVRKVPFQQSATTTAASIKSVTIPTHSPKLEVISKDGYTMEGKMTKSIHKKSLKITFCREKSPREDLTHQFKNFCAIP